MAIVDYVVMVALNEEDTYFAAVLEQIATATRPARRLRAGAC